MATRLRIVIVGAGLAGLAAAIACAESGHEVLVLEAAKVLAEVCTTKRNNERIAEINVFKVGAGLQITPNASRLLFKWGLQESMEETGCEPRTIAVLRYADGKVLAREEGFDKHMREKYGAPFIDMHRADLHSSMIRRAKEMGVTVKTSARVKDIDLEAASVITESGERYSGDLIVGADGLWSKCRESLLGERDAPLPTGDLAYRIIISVDQLDDPELISMVTQPACRFWVGPGAHAVAYSLKGGTMYNIGLLVPDNLPANVARQTGSVEEMRELFKDWDPVLTKLLDQVEEVEKWKLMHRPEVERWTNEKGSFTLIGDSCHPMLPYLAQGANSAIEDGAVLGAVLKGLTGKDQLPGALKAWETARKSRSEAIVRETFHQRNDFHMADGPAQAARDELFASQLGQSVSVKFPSRWTCPEVQPWLYGYDAYRQAAVAREELLSGRP